MERIIKRISVFLVMLFLVGFIAGNVSAASLYAVDVGHSTIGFAVRHLVVSVTRGVFTDFSGEIEFDQETGYSSRKMYINGLKKGDRIFLNQITEKGE